MDMEGRGYSDLLRNSSEEMVLASLIENPFGSSTPNMETLGFRNSLQNFRVDSEELFNNWLMNGEIPDFSSGNAAHRARQLSRKISTEVIAFSNQQNGAAQKQNMEDKSLSVFNDQSQDVQFSIRNAAEKSMQASNLFLAKAWFHSSQPMTRSRSSELRRRYVAMQNSQMQATAEAQNNTTVSGADKVAPKLTNELCDISMVETTSQLQKFISPSNSATSPIDAPPMGMVDTVSSVVSMLRGSLEKKRLDRHVDAENLEGTSNGFSNHQPEGNLICNQDNMNQICWPTSMFQLVSTIPEQNSRTSIVKMTLDLPNMEAFVAPANQFQTGTISQEPSQSESSTAVPTLSTGFEVGDDLANSAQTISACESSKKHAGNGILNHKPGENRENMLQNKFNNGRKASGVSDSKKGNLIRVGSVSSALSVDKGDPTKKRRVERSRKMAEAKERNLAPALPTDMQAVLKRCETLEKEVRSLKLNLSFMNRKDSEQTKHIEELQKQNDDLKDEKRRLVEEIERIYPENGNW